MIKAIILDFDGIILETNHIKGKGFVHLFREYPQDIQEKVKEAHRINGGLSRYKIFEIVYRDFLKKPLTEDIKNRLAQEFSDYCYKEILRAAFVPGMDTFLSWAYQKYPLFIISGTPEDEVRNTVKVHKLDKYFKGIYGSPRTKTQLCQFILDEFNYSTSDVIFVGDSINDLEGAEETGIPFVARIRNDNAEIFENKDVYKVEDFMGFDKFITNLNNSEVKAL